jgi:hypothetical protein
MVSNGIILYPNTNWFVVFVTKHCFWLKASGSSFYNAQNKREHFVYQCLNKILDKMSYHFSFKARKNNYFKTKYLCN